MGCYHCSATDPAYSSTYTRWVERRRLREQFSEGHRDPFAPLEDASASTADVGKLSSRGCCRISIARATFFYTRSHRCLGFFVWSFADDAALAHCLFQGALEPCLVWPAARPRPWPASKVGCTLRLPPMSGCFLSYVGLWWCACSCVLPFYIHYDGNLWWHPFLGGGSSWLLRRAFQVGHKKSSFCAYSRGWRRLNMCPCFAEVNGLQAFWAHHAPPGCTLRLPPMSGCFLSYVGLWWCACSCVLPFYIHYDGNLWWHPFLGGGSSWLLRRAFQVGHKKSSFCAYSRGWRRLNMTI